MTGQVLANEDYQAWAAMQAENDHATDEEPWTPAPIEEDEDEHEGTIGGRPTVVELDPASVMVPDLFNDAYVSAALSESLRGGWLYVAQWKRWLRWDGRRWAHDESEAIYEVARQWAIELVAAVARVGSQDDVKRATGYLNRSKIESALTMARRIEGIATEAAAFDRHPDLLTVGNGTVDLRSGDLLAHDPAHRITKLAGGDYVPGTSHPDVDKVLAVVTPSVREWLQVVFGYAATGHTHEALVPVFDGGGGNGKSTLLEAVGAALGDHAGPIPSKLIMKTAHDQHEAILTSLQGLRLGTLVETEEGGALRLEQVKAISGGDTISARYMYGNFFTFEPTHLLVIATNHRPLVNSTERAAWRRLRLVKFPYTYKAADEADEAAGDRIIDPWLMHRLKANEDARNAMLAWIIDGARRWHADGIGSCPEVDTATDEWRRDEDTIARFCFDRLDFGPGVSTRGSDLYDAYTGWCLDEGRKAKSNKNFAADFLAHEDVQAAGVEKILRKRAAFYEGVILDVER